MLRAGLAVSGFWVALTSPVESLESPLRVVTVGGKAEVQAGGTGAWSAARLRTELSPGASARTLQPGRLALQTASGQTLRLAPQSRVVLLGDGAPDQPTAVRLDGGTVWVAVLPGSPPQEQIEVQTGTMTVTVGGGGVEMTLGRDGSVLVRVYHGTAICSGPGTERQWSRVLGSGQELFAPSGARPGEPGKIDREKIHPDWAKWNEDQDLAGGYGSRPPEK